MGLGPPPAPPCGVRSALDICSLGRTAGTWGFLYLRAVTHSTGQLVRGLPLDQRGDTLLPACLRCVLRFGAPFSHLLPVWRGRGAVCSPAAAMSMRSQVTSGPPCQLPEAPIVGG